MLTRFFTITHSKASGNTPEMLKTESYLRTLIIGILIKDFAELMQYNLKTEKLVLN